MRFDGVIVRDGRREYFVNTRNGRVLALEPQVAEVHSWLSATPVLQLAGLAPDTYRFDYALRFLASQSEPAQRLVVACRDIREALLTLEHERNGLPAPYQALLEHACAVLASLVSRDERASEAHYTAWYLLVSRALERCAEHVALNVRY